MKSTICITTIVKNEEKIIKRMIDSWKDQVDYWVIIDTGSTDKTVEIIKKELPTDKYPGELHQRKWVNMGHNRTEAFELSKDKGDFHFIVDADEVVEWDKDWRKELDEIKKQDFDMAMVKVNRPEIGWCMDSQRIMRTDRDFYARLPYHCSFLAKKSKNKTPLIMKTIKIRDYHDGIRTKGMNNKEKYEPVVKALEEQMIKDPKDSRAQFYLAQTYANLKQKQKAIKAYKKRIKMGGWHEEIYCSLHEIARLTQKEKDFIKAWHFRPTRVEALFDLTNLYRKKENNKKALEYGMIIHRMPLTTDILFVNNHIQNYLILDLLFMISYHLKRYKTALRLGLELLLKKESEPQKPRIIQNCMFALEKMKGK